MNSIALIIPAAGSGSRLNKKTPKPYLCVAGKSILEHTVSRFVHLEGLSEIVIATSEQYVAKAELLLANVISAPQKVKVVAGGMERQHSTFNALKIIETADLVIVHDAVRPFVQTEQVEACCRAAEDVGAAVLGVPAKDTIKQVDSNLRVTGTPPRKFLWQTQTPQVFKKEILLEAYNKAFEDEFLGTDDATLVERLDLPVQMVEGNLANFKITYPVDLKLAQMLLEEERGRYE